MHELILMNEHNKAQFSIVSNSKAMLNNTGGVQLSFLFYYRNHE